MNPYLLHSYDYATRYPNELLAFRHTFGEERTGTAVYKIPPGSLVIPRYRAIPFGRELQTEVEGNGSTLINSYLQHRSIANLFNWVSLLEGLTPAAYGIHQLPYLPEGEYFVKGETNSIKNRWFESAYAPTREALLTVVRNVQGDQYVGGQGLVIRPFQHYRQLTTAVDGRPVFHERRVFVLAGQVLTSAFYWSSHRELLPVADVQEEKFEATLAEAVEKVGHLAPFLVIDLAEYPDGSWGVVELNDGCMSGLSETLPQHLWGAFKRVAAELF